MRTGTGVFAALTWFLVAAPALSAAHAEPLTHLYTVAVDVDAQGHVVGTKPAADTPAPIAVVLDQALKQWRFAPVMQEGHAASVHSYLVADVQALPAEAGKFSVRVSYVGIGPGYHEPNTGKGPDYPQQVLRALGEGGSARVAVDLALPPEGKLTATDAHLMTQAKLNMRERLSLLAAVKRYFLQGSILPETVGGHAVAAKVQQSMTVSLIPAGSKIEVFGSSGAYEALDIDAGPNTQQAAAAQATAAVAAKRDAAQSHSVLTPSMVETVTFQP